MAAPSGAQHVWSPVLVVLLVSLLLLADQQHGCRGTHCAWRWCRVRSCAACHRAQRWQSMPRRGAVGAEATGASVNLDVRVSSCPQVCHKALAP